MAIFGTVVLLIPVPVAIYSEVVLVAELVAEPEPAPVAALVAEPAAM